MMRAPDGWLVEQVVLDRGKGPVTYLRVKQHGTVSTSWPNGGYCATIAQVAAIMGPAFSTLVPAVA